MRRLSFFLALAPLASAGSAQVPDSIAFIKGDHVFIANGNGTNLRQIDKDSRRKSSLRWDPRRQRLGYLAHRVSNELSRLVVIDLKGEPRGQRGGGRERIRRLPDRAFRRNGDAGNAERERGAERSERECA